MKTGKVAIDLKNITHSFPDSLNLFRDFSLQVGMSERIAIVGASGAGKSTLLEIIAGLELVQKGERILSSHEGSRPRIGYISQKDALLPWYTITRNIQLQMMLSNLKEHTTVSYENDWINKLGLLETQDKLPDQLSGGERQRASIAMTLSANPDILLLDEPSASLDFQSKLLLEEHLVRLVYGDAPRTTILVTHDIDQALILADRVLVLGRHQKDPAKIVFELSVELNVSERQPILARKSQFVRDAFEEIWGKLRPFVRTT
tara:strand:- start:18041 stop:18823 length:783 start_codon:yes stop_codon:yes gene_type:complete